MKNRELIARLQARDPDATAFTQDELAPGIAQQGQGLREITDDSVLGDEIQTPGAKEGDTILSTRAAS